MEPPERLTVLPEVLRLVRVFWSTVPAERVVEEPVLRLVVAVPEVLRLVVEPVLRLVRVFWSTVPAERVVEEPVLRLVVAVPEELRLVRSFWRIALAERLGAALEERVEDTEEPDERLTEEDPRVVVWEEDDRVAVEDPPERRDWASASGAAIITKVTRSAAKVLIILFMALKFKR